MPPPRLPPWDVAHERYQLANSLSTAAQAIDLLEYPQEGSADARVLENKQKVAAHFAMTQGLTHAGWAKTVMDMAANQQTDTIAVTAARS